jgi:hypothetical protein
MVAAVIIISAVCFVALSNYLGGEKYLLFNNLRKDLKKLRRRT